MNCHQLVVATQSLLLLCTGFPGGSVIKNPPANAGDSGLIPRLGRSPVKGNGNPLQYSWPSLVAQMVNNLPEIRET